jgi:RNA polymerase sigma-70 factor (ECF subfamily)
LSDSVIEAFQSFDRYRGEGFDKWLFRILTTNRIDMTRRAKVRRSESLDTAFADDDGVGSHGRAVADTGADPARIVIDPVMSEDVQAALDALPEDFRAVLLLCDVEEMEYHDIARVLNLPIGTVRSRIHRARTQMRRSLEKAGRRG